jgi:hypothetical protein
LREFRDEIDRLQVGDRARQSALCRSEAWLSAPQKVNLGKDPRECLLMKDPEAFHDDPRAERIELVRSYPTGLRQHALFQNRSP